jgi:hypothetical protein
MVAIQAPLPAMTRIAYQEWHNHDALRLVSSGEMRGGSLLK